MEFGRSRVVGLVVGVGKEGKEEVGMEEGFVVEVWDGAVMDEMFVLDELECRVVVALLLLLSREGTVLELLPWWWCCWCCWRCVSEECEEELCWRGRPISGPALEEVRRVLLLVACVARLNMCGMRDRLRVDAVLPSVGWICW